MNKSHYLFVHVWLDTPTAAIHMPTAVIHSAEPALLLWSGAGISSGSSSIQTVAEF